MNWKKYLMVLLVTILITNVCFLLSSDFVLYKKINIQDEKSQIDDINQCIFDSSGNIYILRFNRVYKYNNKGEFVGEIIKKGYGPDEIALSARIIIGESADTLVIHDLEKQKITLFDLNGKYIKTIDSPSKKTGWMLASNNLGDYYLYMGSIKGECQLLHLDKDFKPLNCFFPYTGKIDWSKVIPVAGINFDSDLKGNIYVADHYDYNIHVFTRNGDFINSFASPGKNYKKLVGDPPSDNNKFYKWRNSASIVRSIKIIENKILIVFYRDSGKDSQNYYDIYSLDGKKVTSGAIEKGFKPVGKDQQGRLVCAKTEISADGTDVTYWLYIYSINNKKLKL